MPTEDSLEDETKDDRDEDDLHRRQCGFSHPVVELDASVFLEKHGNPEHGEGVEEEGQEGDNVVEPRVLADRGENTNDDTDDDGDHRGKNNETEG